MTSAGIATVTATVGNLTASATITVVTGTLPAGTVRWTSAPGAPGAVVSDGPLFTNRAEASVLDLYVLEHTPAGSQLLHGVFADGTPGNVWTASPDSSSFVTPSLADRNGGAILDLSSWGDIGSQRAFVRIPGTADGLPWRYEAASIEPTLVGQSPDGTVYILDSADNGWTRHVVGLDGETGEVRFRYTPPGTNYRAYYHQECNALSNSIWESGAELSHAVVGYDGALYAFALTSRSVHDDYATVCGLPPSAPEEEHATISVVRVTAEGAATVYELQTAEGTNWLNGWTLVPDPRGGVHAEWSSPDTTGETLHARVGPGLSSAVQSGPLGFDRIGDGVGFDGAGTAYDLDTGAVKYTPAQTGQFVAALAGGGVALTDGQTLWQTDETGTVIRETPMPGAAAAAAARMTVSTAYGAELSYLGEALWMVDDDGGMSLLEGEALADWPAVYPDLNGANQPGTAKAIEIAVHLMTPWWSEIDEQDDKNLIRAAAESELNEAFRGYVVSFTFDEQKVTSDTKRRHVWVKPNNGPGDAVGVTSSMLKFSDVYLRSLANALLTVRCPASATTLAECSTETGIPRPALVTALGRGLGATMAHELGHQNGLKFSQDLEATPSNCYDAKSAVHLDHFFSPLGWSPEAKVLMSKVLLRR